jgi:hypothetical protein
MTRLKAAEDAVVTADRRLTARAESLRANWWDAKCSLRRKLTSPAMVGSAFVIAGMIGARKAAPPKALECECTKASPSLFQQIFLVAVTPALEHAAIAAWKQFAAAVWTTPAEPAPSGETELPIEGGFSAP